MKLSSLIGHAVEAYSIFRSNPVVPADAVMRRFFYDRKYLGSKDRRFVSGVYYRTIKNWWRLDALVEDCLGPRTSDRMVVACTGVLMERTLEEISEVVRELKSKDEFTEEGLRCLYDRDREEQRLAKLSEIERLAIYYSFPEWFVERIRVEYGEGEVERILDSLNGEAPTVLRVNTLITDRETLHNELEQSGCETLYSAMAEEALILTKRVNVFAMEPFLSGKFEVQDEGSQLVAPFANIRKTSIKALDACAGAGGKSLHLAALMKNRGEIYSTDVDDRKLDALRERSRRSGAQNIRIVKQDQRAAMLSDKDGWFDLLLLDVPCTGTGTVRRNPGIKWLLTEQMLHELIEKQRAIFEDNLHFVKNGGTILYATCSILKEEGEEQIDWFTKQHADLEVEEMRRTRPDESGCDAFFIARLRKKSSPSAV